MATTTAMTMTVILDFFGSAAGLSANGDQLWHQNTAGVPGTAEEFDFFGDALAVGDTGPAATATSPSGTSTSRARRTPLASPLATPTALVAARAGSPSA